MGYPRLPSARAVSDLARRGRRRWRKVRTAPGHRGDRERRDGPLARRLGHGGAEWMLFRCEPPQRRPAQPEPGDSREASAAKVQPIEQHDVEEAERCRDDRDEPGYRWMA